LQTLTFLGTNFQPGAWLVYRPTAGRAPTVIQEGIQVAATGTSLTFTWTPPLAAVGTYDVAVRNPDGQVSLPPYAQVTVAAPAPPPDLTASVALTAPNPLPGSQVSVTALIHNRAPGPAAASTASVSFSGPGIGPEPLSFPVSPLEGQAGSPPQTRSFTLSQPGAYSVKVCADAPANQIAEADETNNCASQTVIVSAPPPLPRPSCRLIFTPTHGPAGTTPVRISWETQEHDARTLISFVCKNPDTGVLLLSGSLPPAPPLVSYPDQPTTCVITVQNGPHTASCEASFTVP
ncbi:MAG: hypothetical protein HYW10_07415, partial [Candidatus Omnitrophica bacterium]|nr:hypothetical protein [Candidatus Omnitrophota bacterium]